ncbi:MAG: SsrA-binding protein SmpB [Candidatus Krumholzibacteria bacterium]|jgi:SsrA-binding protein|nr:SsrA-binding protein SmpB [Candidatus Krumholzibacteria bacterium]MDP6669108.1 SsrA-binding protein SmpB [Candidatus Krumholzibacteria bacterium]MDP6797487.1 SsrA-binding protein SmpB [Candidatus Krumholzibacteria bacterium]MDP7021977.1 SsrA-binding protein SmpB [Candidatus Krumholzibacteria bacterium]
MSKEVKTVCVNRKARYDYHLLERWEAGLQLTGTEVKSLRAGRANLKDSWARLEKGELWLVGLHISPYEQGNRSNHEPERPRKLLLNARELRKIRRQLIEKGLTLVPISVYFTARGWAKVEVALARGKRQYDKRQTVAKRDSDRALARARKREES